MSIYKADLEEQQQTTLAWFLGLVEAIVTPSTYSHLLAKVVRLQI